MSTSMATGPVEESKQHRIRDDGDILNVHPIIPPMGHQCGAAPSADSNHQDSREELQTGAGLSYKPPVRLKPVNKKSVRDSNYQYSYPVISTRGHPKPGQLLVLATEGTADTKVLMSLSPILNWMGFRHYQDFLKEMKECLTGSAEAEYPHREMEKSEGKWREYSCVLLSRGSRV
ncbi:hypothetical protein HGM15179_004935 [Zosterops borbonicus]|uniref:Uncharacterized protein n=1 Tax=Zosterops borbonicus TaxID=364589 RepID=A0A8K1GQF5_9PASS|nr:hypothetical protein HGM15179_004935 [Zosterops borbonicus]